MESLEVKSVTFYQTVRLNGQEEKTVGSGSSRNTKNTQIVFCEDKIFIRDPDWKRHNKDTVSIIGLHNVRHLAVDVCNFISSPYKDVFKIIKAAKSKEEFVVTPTTPAIPPSNIVIDSTIPIKPASDKPQSVNPKIGTVQTQVDDPSFELMDNDEKQILLKMELKRFKIDFDKRWGVDKLLNQFNVERAKL